MVHGAVYMAAIWPHVCYVKRPLWSYNLGFAFHQLCSFLEPRNVFFIRKEDWMELRWTDQPATGCESFRLSICLNGCPGRCPYWIQAMQMRPPPKKKEQPVIKVTKVQTSRTSMTVNADVVNNLSFTIHLYSTNQIFQVLEVQGTKLRN